MELVFPSNVDDAMVNEDICPPLTVQFFVPGIPKPKGSMRAFKSATTNRVILINDSKGTKPWQETVSAIAREHCKIPFSTPVFLYLEFTMPKPKKPKFSKPGVKPDLSKLLRCVEDALSKIVYVDDALVVGVTLKEIYGKETGVYVVVGLMPG